MNENEYTGCFFKGVKNFLSVNILTSKLYIKNLLVSRHNKYTYNFKYQKLPHEKWVLLITLYGTDVLICDDFFSNAIWGIASLASHATNNENEPFENLRSLSRDTRTFI